MADLLGSDGQVVVITTVWPDSWSAYIAAARHDGPRGQTRPAWLGGCWRGCRT